MAPAIPPETYRSGRRAGLRFRPAEQRRSLRGILAPHVTTTVSEPDMRAAEESAWAEGAARDDEAAFQSDR